MAQEAHATPVPVGALSVQAGSNVVLADVEIGFWRVVAIVFKWMLAAMVAGLLLTPLILIVWSVLAYIVFALFGVMVGSVAPY